jgi:hypothetical protein
MVSLISLKCVPYLIYLFFQKIRNHIKICRVTNKNFFLKICLVSVVSSLKEEAFAVME